MRKLLYILTIFLSLHISLEAKSSKTDVNHLALATLMIYDAKYDKALEELNQVNKKSDKLSSLNFILYLVYCIQNKSYMKKQL